MERFGGGEGQGGDGDADGDAARRGVLFALVVLMPDGDDLLLRWRDELLPVGDCATFKNKRDQVSKTKVLRLERSASDAPRSLNWCCSSRR